MELTAVTSKRSHAFWVFWAASATSSVGSAVGAIALSLTAVLTLHATAFEMGVIAAASYAAWLVIGLPAGVLTQRFPMRRLQVAMDLVRGVAIASIPVTWWLGTLSVAQLVGVALVTGFATVLFDVTNSTFLPSVVPKEQLQQRNSLMSGTHAASLLSGPSLGGICVQLLGAVPTLLVDAASYLASAVLLRRLPERKAPTTGESRMRPMIREGWEYVTGHPIMGPCMWVATVINFVCGGQMALFALYLVRVLHAPAALVGFLLAAEGVGSLLGAALVPPVTRAVGSARACVLAGVVLLGGAVLIPVGTGWFGDAMFVLGNIVFAGGVVVVSTTTRTYRQIASPPELLSRVMATVRFVSWGAIPVGGLAAGALATALGARNALFTLALLTVLAPFVLLSSPVRRLRDLPDH